MADKTYSSFSEYYDECHIPIGHPSPTNKLTHVVGFLAGVAGALYYAYLQLYLYALFAYLGILTTACVLAHLLFEGPSNVLD